MLFPEAASAAGSQFVAFLMRAGQIHRATGVAIHPSSHAAESTTAVAAHDQHV